MPEQPDSTTAVLPVDDFPSRAGLLVRGLTRRCPWCGDWHAYFTGWFKRTERCRRCGHGFRRGDHAFELGALTANIMLTFGAVLLAIVLSVALTLPDLSLPWVIGSTVAVALVGPALWYPVSYTLWQAIDLWMRPPTKAELAGEGDARL